SRRVGRALLRIEAPLGLRWALPGPAEDLAHVARDALGTEIGEQLGVVEGARDPRLRPWIVHAARDGGRERRVRRRRIAPPEDDLAEEPLRVGIPGREASRPPQGALR